MRFQQTVLPGETCLYSRQISHVKPLDGVRAVRDGNFRASPSQFTHLEYVERNLKTQNELPLPHGLLDFPAGVVGLELLSLIVQLAPLADTQFDLHKPA